MSHENPAFEGGKKFVDKDSEDGGGIKFQDSNKLSKREMILVLLLILIVVLSIVFLVLYVKEKNRAGDEGSNVGGRNKSTDGRQGNESTIAPNKTVSPTTRPDYGIGPWQNVRLPKYFEPMHYNVVISVDIKNLVFAGNVSVDVKLKSAVKHMFLHVNKLIITKPRLFKSDGSQMPLERDFFYKKNQFYVLDPGKELEKGSYNVKMEFTGKLDNDLKGLYRSTYKNKNGTEITIATTQLQPTDARKVFPCFDEPSYKATFTVTLVRHEDLISITNMPRIKSVPVGNNMVADHYEKTVKMPTYLLAFIICDFDYKQSYAGVKNSSMRYYATKEQVDQVEYASSIGGEILECFEQYFNISYPLPKADMIAIPDFAAGAMENWGLITYRETALLYKNGQSSEVNKERITVVISHELAHMWFGNLVTTEWWDDLWLNEGFASFVEYIGIDKVKPDWKMKDMFVILDMSRAFALDALVTSHPILVPVNHPDEINEIFDSISYNKGASIIRMLQYFLGEDLFKRGLTNYLIRHSYGNAKTKDLWKALTEAATKAGKTYDVAEIMDTWTLQMGFPVVNVTSRGGAILLTQQRFLSDRSANQSNTKYTSKYGYKWNIPFTIEVHERNSSMIYNQTALNVTWMNYTSDETTVEGKTWNPSMQWVKGNIDQTGFYRVNYPVENWKFLAEQLLYNHKVLSASDRAGLIQDAFALADAKYLEFKYALDLTKYLHNEQSYVPWSAAYSSISGLINILPKTRKVYKGFKEYRYQKMRPTLDRLGFEDKGSHLDKYLRTDAIYAACSIRNETCLKITKDYFDKWIKSDTKWPVPADLRSPVYFYGISQSGEEEWDIAFERLEKTNVASERRKLMYGLAGTPEPWLINRYLQYAFDESKIKSQDTSTVLSYIANYNPIGRHFAWNFLKEKWPVILERYGSGLGFAMNRFVNGVASAFSTKWELEELERLFEKYPASGSGTRARDQLLETVRSNIQWRLENEKSIEDWLATVNIF